MKKLINPFKGFILLAFALTPLLSIAHDGDNVDKKRTITKTYTVGPDDRLTIENSFGNVSVETWDKNVIQVDVEIGVRASSDEKAQQMLDQISVTDHQGGHEIEFKTDIGRMGGKGNNNRNEENRRFYIDYKISMPAKNPLHIENSFGKTNIPDFSGQASLTSKFGELTTGKITNAKLIHVEFGKADIGWLTNADVVFKFNSKSSVAGISGNSKVDVEFCSQVNVLIDNAIKELSVYESYSTVNLRVSPSLSAQFEVYTNFGSYKNKTGFNISEENEDDNSGPKFDKNYSGTAGSGAAKIKIKSSFGSVRMLNENDKSPDKDDSKDEKDEDRDKVNL
jgi:hypothetical protein